MEGLAGQVPGLGAMMADSFDGWAAEDGCVDERMRGLVRLAERLSRPETLATLQMMVDTVEQAPQLVATVTDIADDLMARAAEQGLDTGDLLEQIRAAAMGLLRITTSAEVRDLLESEMLATGALQTLSRVAHALADARTRPPPPTGLFGAIRALSDPDVQRVLGLAIGVAREVGGSLEPGTRALTEGDAGEGAES